MGNGITPGLGGGGIKPVDGNLPRDGWPGETEHGGNLKPLGMWPII